MNVGELAAAVQAFQDGRGEATADDDELLLGGTDEDCWCLGDWLVEELVDEAEAECCSGCGCCWVWPPESPNSLRAASSSCRLLCSLSTLDSKSHILVEFISDTNPC